MKEALRHYNLQGIPKLSLPENSFKGIYKAYINYVMIYMTRKNIIKNYSY